MEGGRGRNRPKKKTGRAQHITPNMGRQPRNLGHRGLLEITRAATLPVST
jgi:hypothetical protein